LPTEIKIEINDRFNINENKKSGININSYTRVKKHVTDFKFSARYK